MRVHKRKRQRGFGLLEILIAIGVLSILLLVTLRLFRSSASFQRHLGQKGENIELQDTIELFLRDGIACPKLFNNQTISLTDLTILPKLFRPDGSVLIEAGKNFGQLLVESVQLKTPTLLEGTRYFAQLEIKVTKFGEPTMASPGYTSEFDLIFVSDGTSKIIGCQNGDSGGGFSLEAGYITASKDMGPATNIELVTLYWYSAHIPVHIAKQSDGSLKAFYRTGASTTGSVTVDGTLRTVCIDTCATEGIKVKTQGGNLIVQSSGGISHYVKYFKPAPPLEVFSNLKNLVARGESMGDSISSVSIVLVRFS